MRTETVFNPDVSLVVRFDAATVDTLIGALARIGDSVVPDIGLPADLDADMWAITIAVFEFIISLLS